VYINTMTCTENGAPAYASTLDPRLNLFFKTVRDLGDFENSDAACNSLLYELVKSSWEVDKLDTLKILMNWRDCRGGKGDYSGFLVAMAYLYKLDPSWVEATIVD